MTAIDSRSAEGATRPAAISRTTASARTVARLGYATCLAALALAATRVYGAPGTVDVVNWLLLR